MKTRFNLRLVAAQFLMAAFLFTPFVTQVSAINVSEPPDFSNTAPGSTYTLSAGANTFSGTVTTPSDSQDHFQVTVPAGLQINQVSKTVTGGGFSGFVSFNNETISGTGTANFTGQFATPYPLPAGTYEAYASADFSTGSAWSVTVTVGTAPDYTVTTGGGSITLTDNSGNGDTLAITNPTSNSLLFSVPGRLFSVNGGANRNNDSGNLSLSGVTDIYVHAGGGNYTINVSAFSGTTFPDLSLYAGTTNTTVNFNGNINFAPGNFLDVELQNNTPATNIVNVAPNVNLVTSGTGYIYMFASQNIQLGSGSSLVVQNGDLDVEANQQSPATTGNFIGVNLDGATLKSTGMGNIFVNGTGGNAPGGYQLGVQVINGAKIYGGSTNVFINGYGGASTGIVNRGVTIYGAGSVITSSNGTVSVTGHSGQAGSYYGIGVSVLFGAEISAGGNGLVIVAGTGGGAGGFNMGLEMGSAGSRICSNGGNVNVNGGSGTGPSYGIYLASSAAIYTPANGGSVNFYADTVSLDGTATITASNGTSHVQFTPAPPSTNIDLGTAGATATLGITASELTEITTANLYFVDHAGPITISQPVTITGTTNFSFFCDPAGLVPAAVGVDISLPAGTVNLASGPLVCAINGGAPDTGYGKLNVIGKVNLNGAKLILKGAYAGAYGDTFTLVDNDGTDPVIGTFSNLQENAYLFLSGQPAQIHYAGGTGNDVVLVRTLPKLSTTAKLTNGVWQFTGTGVPTNVYAIQATTNFINWTNLGFATGNVNGAFSFIDSNAFRFKYRFYRTTN
ncbi:MAG: hypothetical protein P4N60_04475 [Verrucomicrobiae bacterium]|nr:hypothetical protein [Verrucomicrobiae bacterium]